MGLFGFIGTLISGVGSVISSVGQAAGNEALANQPDFAGGPRYTYGHYHERFPNARNVNNDPDLIIYLSNELGLQVNPEWLESQ